MPRAVVFAYHNVGARCLRVLLAHGVDVPLVVTHEDDPAETLWFERGGRRRAANTASRRSRRPIPTTPASSRAIARARAAISCSASTTGRCWRRRCSRCRARGALNMHGSLLPKYRGRAPVNWAVLHGERETGATLHYMAAKPDAGDIVDADGGADPARRHRARGLRQGHGRRRDHARSARCPRLIAGTAPRTPQDLAARQLLRRTPAGGRTHRLVAGRGAIHNLVRAVAPPYPGALTHVGGRPARILAHARARHRGPQRPATLAVVDGRLVARCGGGGTLGVIDWKSTARPSPPGIRAAIRRRCGHARRRRAMSISDRTWSREAVRIIEADFNRSADTHLIPLRLPGLPGCRST